MMTRWQRLEMAAFIQEADDVYTTKDGFGIVCVKNGLTRIFVLDEPARHLKKSRGKLLASLG